MDIFHEILGFCGWTEYQAACLAPYLVAVLALMALAWGVGVVYDIMEARKQHQRKE